MKDRQKLAEELVNIIVKNIDKNYELMANWGKAFQIVFTDINVGYFIKVAMNGKLEKLEKAIKKNKAAVTMIVDTPDSLKAIFDGMMSPITALQQGKIKVEGSMDELIKMQLAFP